MKMLKNKDLDFLSVVKTETSRADPDRSKKTLLVAVPTIALAVFAGVWCYFQFSALEINKELENLDAQIQQIQASDEYKSVQDGMKILTETEAYVQNSRKLIAVKDSFPVTDAGTLQTLQDNCPDGTGIVSVNYASNFAFLIVSGEADQPEDVADYTENLRNAGFYINVKEEGYSKAEEDGSRYYFTIYTNLIPGQSVLDLEGMVTVDEQ